jgi:hypothetical protein
MRRGDPTPSGDVFVAGGSFQVSYGGLDELRAVLGGSAPAQGEAAGLPDVSARQAASEWHGEGERLFGNGEYAAAVGAYSKVIGLDESLQHPTNEDRNDLAGAYMGRGVAKQDAPGHGGLAAIADYDRAISIREELRRALGEDWPVPWCNDLATAYMNRGNAKWGAPGHGGLAAIADYDRAIAMMEQTLLHI